MNKQDTNADTNTYTSDYLLNRRVRIFQPQNGYRASTDAVFLAAAVNSAGIAKEAKILDVGSGTGAVSLCLAARLAEKNIHIIGLDIQSELVSLSNMSARANGFEAFLKYETADIRCKSILPPQSFDLVVTNPPYSDHDMPSPNLGKRLAHNHQNFALTGWLSFCLKMLKPKGEICLINRTEALNEILASFHNKAGDTRIIPFYTKPEQPAKRIIVTARKGSRGITQILPPLTVYEPDGKNYTPQAENILRNMVGLR